MFIPVAWYFLLGNANHPGFQQPSLSPRWAPPGILCVSFWSRSGMFQQSNFEEFTNRNLITLVGSFQRGMWGWLSLSLFNVQKIKVEKFQQGVTKSNINNFPLEKYLCGFGWWFWERYFFILFFDKGILGVLNQNPKKLQQPLPLVTGP